MLNALQFRKTVNVPAINSTEAETLNNVESAPGYISLADIRIPFFTRKFPCRCRRVVCSTCWIAFFVFCQTTEWLMQNARNFSQNLIYGFTRKKLAAFSWLVSFPYHFWNLLPHLIAKLTQFGKHFLTRWLVNV